jgi:hypothetical protein
MSCSSRIPCLLIACLVPTLAAAQELRTPVFLELPEGHSGPITAELHFSYFHPEKKTILRQTTNVEVPRHSTFAGALGRIAHIQVLAPGYWSPPATLGVSADPIHIRLLPTGRVEGSLRLPPGEEIPAEVEAHFEPAAEGETADPIPAGSVVCPVAAEQTTFHCEIPAGKLKLRFQAEGFAPFPRPVTAVPEGGEVTVGVVILRRAESISRRERP